MSKLYTCLDLQKFDEAAQACDMLLEFRQTKAAQGVPELEERCVRAVVGGVLQKYASAKSSREHGPLDAARRSLTRVNDLLDRLSATSKEPWIFETIAIFYSQVGRDEQVYENLMKEYRSLQSVRGWEKDDAQVRKVCQVVTQIVRFQTDSKENIGKSKYLITGVIKRVEQSRIDKTKIPQEIGRLKSLLDEIGNDSGLEQQTEDNTIMTTR